MCISYSGDGLNDFGHIRDVYYLLFGFSMWVLVLISFSQNLFMWMWLHLDNLHWSTPKKFHFHLLLFSLLLFLLFLVSQLHIFLMRSISLFNHYGEPLHKVTDIFKLSHHFLLLLMLLLKLIALFHYIILYIERTVFIGSWIYKMSWIPLNRDTICKFS